jgi:hypothetical protein
MAIGVPGKAAGASNAGAMQLLMGDGSIPDYIQTYGQNTINRD